MQQLQNTLLSINGLINLKYDNKIKIGIGIHKGKLNINKVTYPTSDKTAKVITLHTCNTMQGVISYLQSRTIDNLLNN